MSSGSFAATIDLALAPSLRAFRWIFVVHVALVALLPLTMEPGMAMAALAAAFAVSWFWLRRHPAFGFGKKAIVRIIWHTEGGWNLQDAAGVRSDAELLGNSYVHPRLLVLNFRLRQGGKRTRVLTGDEADADGLRRLRARLSAFRAER